MRLSVRHIRYIREARLRRDQWCGKALVVIDEYQGFIVFGKPTKRTNRFIFEKKRVSLETRHVRRWNNCGRDRMADSD